MSKVELSLCNFIGIKNLSFVNVALNSSSNIDMLYKEGKYFKLSIKNNSYEITNALLEYFKTNQLDKYVQNSPEYLSLKSQLQYIITDIAEDNDNISPKLKELIKPYLLDQISTEDNHNDHLDIPDPMDNLDPLKHFDNNLSTKENTPEKNIACSGDHDANNTDFEG